MTITCYSGFSKEMNSTAQPLSGTDKTVTLKNPTSILNPVFILNGYDLSYNYIKWGTRYYFVDDIIITHNDVAEYHCSTDVLATYKTAIGNSTQYILRSASDYDGNIIDTFYPIEASQTEIAGTTTSSPDWTHNINSGQFVIGVIGDNSSPNGGAVTYYAIAPSGMKTITSYLLDEANFSGVTDITPDLLKCVFNPIEYIVSCMWFPFIVATLGSNTIHVGWWDIDGISCAKISDPVYTRNFSFSVPKHPQATSRGNYLNMQPYSKYFASVGPWGIISLNNSMLVGEDSISFEIDVDLYTGSGRLTQVCSDVVAGAQIYSAQVGVPIQLGQNTLNQGAISGITSGAGQVLGGVATGNFGSIFNGATTSITSAAELSQSNVSSIGSNGTIAFYNVFKLVGEFMMIADESLAKNGRPLCAPRTINTLSGYIQVHNADVDITGSPAEKQQVMSYLEGGFYYE